MPASEAVENLCVPFLPDKKEYAMRHQLTRLMCQFRRQGQTQATAMPAPLRTPQVLEQAAELDAQTHWPTHRIRSFLLTQRAHRRAD